MLLVGLPVMGLVLWLGALSDRENAEDARVAARRVIDIADARLGSVVTTLNDLGVRGVESCRPVHLEAMRQASFANSALKEISVIAANGKVLCTDTGLGTQQREVITPPPGAEANEVFVEVLRLPERSEHAVRLRRLGSNGISLAGLVPSALLLPQSANRGGPFGAHVRLVTRDGTLVADRGRLPENVRPGDVFVGTAQSARTGLQATVSTERTYSVEHEELRKVGIVIAAILAVVILSFCLLLMRRPKDDPVAEIKRALAAGEFVPYFQPIVDIRSGRLRGVETLMRRRKPDGTIVVPAAFIPLLESTGLIVEATRVLMRQVCTDLGPALSQRPYLHVAFNLTAQHFGDETIVSDLRNIFGGSLIKFDQVVLEVTERQPLENLTETRRVIAAIQGLGAKIAIDDVGTGHSGLSYMLKLGVDIIKIDKMFIDAVGTDRNSSKIIETLIDLAHNMRMEVVAEGVESFEQVVFLRDLGIRAAQGYVFAPPLPLSSFLQLLEAIDPIAAAADGAVAADTSDRASLPAVAVA